MRTVELIDRAARSWARENMIDDYNYGSMSRWYPGAVEAGVITAGEAELVETFYGDRFYWTGD